VLLCGLIGGLRCPAQSATSVDGQPRVQHEISALRAEIDQLLGRLKVLEQRVEAAPATPPPERATEPQSAEADVPTERPVDLSGYIASRYVKDPRSRELGSYQSHTVSVFVGKSLGRWRVHTELEFDHLPEMNLRGMPIARPTGEVELEVGWLNYEYRNWLNARAGLIAIPTYWRLHNYPSVALTVQPPLLYEKIFPPNVSGVMLHGSHYLEDGGFSYSLYAGQGREFLDQDNESHRAIGGNLGWHVPTRHFMNVFDIRFQWYRDSLQQNRQRSIYGFESQIESNRFGFVGEFAHTAVSPPTGGLEQVRQGYYLQPSLRLAGQLFGVYRYDRVKLGDRSPDTVRHTAGLTYRPRSAIALKLEYNRYPNAGGNGFGVGAALFFK
jgi:hypothetical protein